MTTNGKTAERIPRGRTAPRAELARPEAQQTGLLNLDTLYTEVIAEIRQAEDELVAARERLAAARGKLDLLGQMQQRAIAAGAAHGKEKGDATDPSPPK